MINITAFTDKYKDINEVIEEGRQAELLRDNTIFKQAVNEMYTKLTLAEDEMVGKSEIDSREMNAKIKHYSMMRTLLTDFVYTLDGFVQLGENAQYQKAEFGDQ